MSACPEYMKALDYFPNYSLSNIQIYAAELAYMPLSEYDISTHDDFGLKPYIFGSVWNLYFRYGEKKRILLSDGGRNNRKKPIFRQV